uniref:GH18 domain-containing protein n=1 Tax=Timema bartmani TaxID=61472 RepID=A0A7R9I2V0_9NEOP|nr:unnamed protein product [Timema bartmani]
MFLVSDRTLVLLFVTATPRRRLRRPTTSVSSSVSSILRPRGDQETAASSRFKVRSRLTPSGSSIRKTTTTALSGPSKDEGYKVVCYYTNWSQYRPKHGKFLPEDIQPDLCTHVIFAFGWLKKGKLSSFESNDETKDGKTGLYERGWSFGTQKFKVMSATRYSRQTFIYSAIPFLRDRNFDGLDLDWEYPKGSDDKKNFVLLLKDLPHRLEMGWVGVQIPPRVRQTKTTKVSADSNCALDSRGKTVTPS